MLFRMLVLYYLGKREGLEGFPCFSCLNYSILDFCTFKGLKSDFMGKNSSSVCEEWKS